MSFARKNRRKPAKREFSMFLLRHQGEWEPLDRELVQVRKYEPGVDPDPGFLQRDYSEHLYNHFGSRCLSEEGTFYFVNPEWGAVEYLKEQGFRVRMLWDDNGSLRHPARGWNHGVSFKVHSYRGNLSSHLHGNVGFYLVGKDGKVCLDLTKPEHEELNFPGEYNGTDGRNFPPRPQSI